MQGARTFLSFFFLLSPFVSKAHSAEFTPVLAKAHTAVWRMRFVEADRLLLEERKRHPENLVVDFEEVTVSFLKALITEEVPLRREFEASSESFLEKSERLGKGKTEGFIRSEVLMQRALLDARFGDYVRAAFRFRACHSLLSECLESHPDHPPLLLVQGVLESVLSAVPPRFDWILSLAGMKASQDAGKSELETVARETVHADFFQHREELLFIQAQLLLSLHPDRTPGKELMAELARTSDHNELVLSVYCGILMRHGGNDEVISRLSDRKMDVAVFPLPGLLYRLGCARLRKSDPRCIHDFTEFLMCYKGQGMRKSAWQKIGWMRLLDGDKTGYYDAMKRVLLVGNSLAEEDQAAEAEAASAIAPDPGLLRARLAYDGGYYTEALSCLRERGTEGMTREQLLERMYRMSRIFQAMGMEEAAMAGFRSTVAAGRTSSSHYPANSALQLGLYFEGKQQKDSAMRYYRICLSMPDHPYRNSIDRSAREGLRRMENLP